MKPSQTILLADPDADLLKIVSANLATGGWLVVTARDGTEALEKARRVLPALIILEVAMPGIAGTEVLRLLRAEPATAGIAVVLLSASKEEVDRIVGFELGADDYVCKPFSVRELALRARTILARLNGTPTSGCTSVGTITLDRSGHEVRVGGSRIEITVREYRLLTALFGQPGRVFSREELLNTVWGKDSPVDHRTVDTHVRRLRERLGPAARQIRTVRGFGYQLNDAT